MKLIAVLLLAATVGAAAGLAIVYLELTRLDGDWELSW